jgi:hypothetical protein
MTARLLNSGRIVRETVAGSELEHNANREAVGRSCEEDRKFQMQ